MKRLLIIMVIIAIALSPRLFWSMKDSKQLSVEVIDKTVPKKDYREHNGLFQVLDYEKIVDSSGKPYDIGKDYFGFDPYDGVPGVTYDVDSSPDLIYVTDTYGVYSDDLEDNPAGKRSELIDGGMTLLEWNAIMASKTEHTTLLSEFNSFASPTEESVSTIMQKNLGVRWDGWIGRYFPDLSNDEIPDWLITEYEEQTGQKWTFKDEGLAFVHNKGEIVVLDEKGNNGQVEAIPTKLGKDKFPSIRTTPYLYWFDIIEPLAGTDELARYSLNLTETGTSIVKKAGIPTEFPAIVHNSSNQTYYFAGDYADFEKRAFTKWQGFPKMYTYFASDLSEFYWNMYFPMMSDILNQIHEEKER